MPHDFAAIANSLIRLDMGTSRHSLQEYLDRFAASFAFEGQNTRWFITHGIEWKGKKDSARRQPPQ
jgi:hypothetical protein